MTPTVLGRLRLFPTTFKRLSVLSKIFDGASLKEGLIENGYIWVINFLINFSLALIDSGSCTISGIRTQEKQRLASVKRGFKITMLYLTKQHIIVKTRHCLSRQRIETLLTLASPWFRRSCGRLYCSSKFSRTMMNRCGTLSILRSSHFSVILLANLEYVRDIILDFEMIGNPPLLVEKLRPALPLPAAHLQ